jgi:hypothetical protein
MRSEAIYFFYGCYFSVNLEREGFFPFAFAFGALVLGWAIVHIDFSCFSGFGP